MKKIRKILSAITVAALLFVMCAVAPVVSAEESILYFTVEASSGNADGGYYASGVSLHAYGDHGIELVDDLNNVNRCLWAFTNDVINKYPYLHYEIETPETCPYITFTKWWGGEEEIAITDVEGKQCINVLELLKDHDTIGYTYITPYTTDLATVKIKYMYLSNVDADGNIYTPPTQPVVPNNKGGTMVRFDLPAYTEDNLYEMVDSQYGYGWLMTNNLTITQHEDGKGFYMERKEGSKDKYGNIAWVVPYEQLEKTPYLIIEIENEGRADEGPQVAIYSYWEGITGSLAVFDKMGSGYSGANGLNGVNAFNLKYSVEEVDEDLHGPFGIAIIVALNWEDERTDGTVMEQLKIKDAYLMGWEGGTDEGEFEKVANGITDVTTGNTTQQNQTTTTAANNQGNNGNEKSFPIGIVVGAVVAVVVIAAVVVVVLKKKK